MRYRDFGRTGLRVSELSFGGWAIGGQSFGAVETGDALSALARAEELGVNFVDTAAVYGRSEEILGRFLEGRRDRWIVASKYSGQPQGMTALVEDQLRRLGTTWIDFYQLHWVPKENGGELYRELESLREAGKVRFIGVSLYSGDDIDYVLANTEIDAFQAPFSLLDPRPLLYRIPAIAEAGVGVIARSSLKDGFLTGKYTADSAFEDPGDRRSDRSRDEIAATVAAVERFRFLEQEAGSLLRAALSYPLTVPEVSTVVVSTRNAKQASGTFGLEPARFTDETLTRVRDIQEDLGLLRDSLPARIRSYMGRLVRQLRSGRFW